MTYLDLVLAGLFRGLAWVLPLDLLELGPVPADPAIAAVITLSASIGLLLALVIALFPDFSWLGRGLWKAVKRRPDGASRQLGALIATAVPMAGILIAGLASIQFSPLVMGIAVIALGVLLGLADKLGVTVRESEHLTLVQFTLIALLSAGAVWANFSPLVVVLILARVAGCERPSAYRFALLLLVIPLLTQIVDSAIKVATSPVSAPFGDIAVVAATALVVAACAITLTLSWLKRHGLLAFALAHFGIAAWIIAGIWFF